MRTLRSTLKRAIPAGLLNSFLLRHPAVYRLPLVNFETTIDSGRGLRDLLSQLRLTFAVPGDVVECGTSRGGSAVLLARELLAHGVHKRIFALDTFHGFDRTELERERAHGLTTAPYDAFTSTSLDYVTRKIAVLGLQETVVPVPGLFQDTLPDLAGPFSFVFLDCDLRDSSRFCADDLWPKISSSGRLLVDDYHSAEFRGAKVAVEEFIATHSVDVLEHGPLGRFYLFVKK